MNSINKTCLIKKYPRKPDNIRYSDIGVHLTQVKAYFFISKIIKTHNSDPGVNSPIVQGSWDLGFQFISIPS